MKTTYYLLKYNLAQKNPAQSQYESEPVSTTIPSCLNERNSVTLLEPYYASVTAGLWLIHITLLM